MMSLWNDISSEKVAALLAAQGYPGAAMAMYHRIQAAHPDAEGIAEKAGRLASRGHLPPEFERLVPLFDAWTRMMGPAGSRSSRLKQVRKILWRGRRG